LKRFAGRLGIEESIRQSKAGKTRPREATVRNSFAGGCWTPPPGVAKKGPAPCLYDFPHPAPARLRLWAMPEALPPKPPRPRSLQLYTFGAPGPSSRPRAFRRSGVGGASGETPIPPPLCNRVQELTSPIIRGGGYPHGFRRPGPPLRPRATRAEMVFKGHKSPQLTKRCPPTKQFPNNPPSGAQNNNTITKPSFFSLF